MYILSSRVLVNVDPTLAHARNNLDIIDMFDHDIADIYIEIPRTMFVDKQNISHDE